ncbi:putative carboxypeptidase S1 [Blumeria hordei DH14]|uniref:Carboxypeptidase n=1 Tax=Blumeria graminis f. sp. hordei (strain DH14) TaxID=546991 RepID=N1JII2_BLUG1|nr:putative carboxypeptidase S1 [Blumeria hordei DH14]
MRAIFFTVISLTSVLRGRYRYGHKTCNEVPYDGNRESRSIFQHESTGAQIDFVTNSGICETTPGVNQYSGYLSVGTDENMWFWFFEARNNASSAPLAAWFNGGPGCSSMVGLFQENGPCHFVDGSSEPSLNPYSWNEYANMLYIDQPIGVGFSYGNNPVNSTVSAAPLVWKLLQAFYAKFPEYENRDFGIFTESYGGHYGPEFASYIQSQNAAIASGTLEGEVINLKAMGINNGWIDATIQNKAYIDFSYNNTYRPLITKTQYDNYLDTYNTRCLPALKGCNDTVSNDAACSNAHTICVNSIMRPLNNSGDFNVYDIRAPSNDSNPPSTFVKYLNSPAVTNAIGARSPFMANSDNVYEKFSNSGDMQSNLTTLIWAGDADWICNWFGVLTAAESIDFPGASEFRSKEQMDYTVGGKPAGKYKTVDNLSWLRVYGAGHEVPYYKPELSLQVFRQLMGGKIISST